MKSFLDLADSWAVILSNRSKFSGQLFIFNRVKALYHIDNNSFPDEADEHFNENFELLKKSSPQHRDDDLRVCVSGIFQQIEVFKSDVSLINDFVQYFGANEKIKDHILDNVLNSYRKIRSNVVDTAQHYEERRSLASGTSIEKEVINLSKFRLYFIEGTADDVNLEKLIIMKEDLYSMIISYFNEFISYKIKKNSKQTSTPIKEDSLKTFISEQIPLLRSYQKTICMYDLATGHKKIREVEEFQPFFQSIVSKFYSNFEKFLFTFLSTKSRSTSSSSSSFSSLWTVKPANGLPMSAQIVTKQVVISKVDCPLPATDYTQSTRILRSNERSDVC